MRHRHPQTLLLFLCCLGSMWAQPAWARIGIVARLVSSTTLDGEVTMTLVNESGTENVMVLKNDGVSPDVYPNDNTHSASGSLDGMEATVLITIDGETTEVGEVAWQDETTPRDLVITMGEGLLTVEQGMVTRPPSNGELEAQGQEVEGAGPVPPSGRDAPVREPNVTFGSATSTSANRSSETDDTTLYLLAGALVLVLALAAFLWLRAPNAGASSARASRHYEIQPEPGLLGSTTPALTDGLSTWKASSADADDFLPMLLQAMAQHHQVLVVTDEDTQLPLVAGGPVYRARAAAAVAVADAAISLVDQPGLPLAVLVRQEKISAALLNDYATLLTPDVGVVALISNIDGEHGYDVEISRAMGGWRVQRGDSGVHIGMTEWGVRVSPIQGADDAE